MGNTLDKDGYRLSTEQGRRTITNMALGDTNQQVDTLDQILENAAGAGKEMVRLIEALIAKQSTDGKPESLKART